MSDKITVTVSKWGDRPNLYMRYKDPITGKQVARSTGTANLKEARKIAAKWEQDLQENRYKAPSKVTWTEFVDRYSDEVLPTLAHKTAQKAIGVFNAVEELLRIDKLAKLDANQISRFQTLLREKRKNAESTVKSILAHLLASLNWAKQVGLLTEVPAVTMPKRAKGGKLMKGRPICLEEFEKMLDKVPEALFPTKPGEPVGRPVGEFTQAMLDCVERWKWFMRGLWFSGLRLGEATDLSWDIPGSITIDLSGSFPMFVIPADCQKSGQDQLLPVSPEFGEMLLSVPAEARTGRVFQLGRRNATSNPKAIAVSRLVAKAGELANVVVNRKPLKFASAHDFRRSFGERWSTRVMPATLQQMMRHADIGTTMRFYVGQDGQKAAKEIHEAFARHFGKTGNTSCNSPENADIDNQSKLTQSTDGTTVSNKAPVAQ